MKPPVKILVIDDDEDDFLIISDYINAIREQEFLIDWCGNYKEAALKICEAGHDLYFIDYWLGPKTGLELIQEAIKNDCGAPLILLTGNGNRKIDKMAMEYGAVDYLVKSDLNEEKLERTIRYALERATTEKALRNKEQKFRNIFERSKDPVFTVNKDFKFLEVNDATVCMLECSREKLTSKTVFDFLCNQQDVVYIKNELISKGFINDRSTDFNATESGIKNCVVTLSKEADITGTTYYQGIIHEITALKKAEKANLALEKMKMASRILRTMAHEIRNPLNSILLSLGELKEASEKEERALYTDIIARNANRIDKLVSELLNTSTPGEILVEKKPLQSILDESLEAAGDRLNLHNIQLKKDYLRDHAWVMVDSEKLKIALLNIIINAVEAMQKEKGELVISLRENEDLQYEVFIQDNGCGISNENLIKLFEPYFTTKQNGVGLGLASTLNILQSHNVSVDVDSVVSQGTVFKLFFNKA